MKTMKNEKNEITTLYNLCKTKNDQVELIIESINNNDIDQIRTLIDNGAPLHHAYTIGTKECICSLLYYALLKNDIRIVELLIEKGVDVNKPDGKLCGYPPLFYSVFLKNDIRIVELLIKKGADIYHITPDGYTFLSALACYEQYNTLIYNLLEKNLIDIHIKTRYNDDVLSISEKYNKNLYSFLKN